MSKKFIFHINSGDETKTVSEENLAEYTRYIGLDRIASGRCSWLFVMNLLLFDKINGIDPKLVVEEIEVLEGVEKDYYLTVILNNIEGLLSDKIVFKGGTLLNKVHLNYHRLSEDLDFTYHGDLSARSQRSKAITPIREKMPSFLKALELESDHPRGEGFNNSTQYVFKIKYPSLITAKNESIKIEVSLRQPPLDKPVHTVIKHFYQDPFTGEDLFSSGKILSLSLNEAVAEKLKAAISRKDVAIRDYYDLWHIAESGFDFYQDKFIKLFKRKLSDEGHDIDYRKDFGLSAEKFAILRRQVDTDLMPVIRADERFDLEKVLDRFNKIFLDKRFN